jgi:hypothetical protein
MKSDSGQYPSIVPGYKTAPVLRICMEGRKGSTPAEPNDHKDGFSTGGKSGNEDGIFHNKMTEVFPELNRPQKQKISYRR